MEDKELFALLGVVITASVTILGNRWMKVIEHRDKTTSDNREKKIPIYTGALCRLSPIVMAHFETKYASPSTALSKESKIQLGQVTRELMMWASPKVFATYLLFRGELSKTEGTLSDRVDKFSSALSTFIAAIREDLGHADAPWPEGISEAVGLVFFADTYDLKSDSMPAQSSLDVFKA